MRNQILFIAAMASMSLLTGCVVPQYNPPPTVPQRLKAPSDQTLLLEAHAIGVQIYACSVSKTDAGRFEWVFMAPEADLLDKDGTQIGKHYAGPSWESKDGSKVVGEVQANSDSPDTNAIPWLLLKAKSTSGNGVFSQVRSVQRLATIGGKAPAETCDQTQLGRAARIAYRATYYFYTQS
jgi:hypothetical protein